jgi:hypothetical protein
LQALSDQQRGIVMLGLFANALIGTISHVALGIALIRSVYRSWHARQLGLLGVVRAGVNPLLIGALAAHVTWRIALAWAGRAADDGRGQAWLGRVDRWITDAQMPPDNYSATEPKPLPACCYRSGSADAARSRATDPATTRAEPAAILGLRRCTARGTRRP